MFCCEPVCNGGVDVDSGILNNKDRRSERMMRFIGANQCKIGSRRMVASGC